MLRTKVYVSLLMMEKHGLAPTAACGEMDGVSVYGRGIVTNKLSADAEYQSRQMPVYMSWEMVVGPASLGMHSFHDISKVCSHAESPAMTR
jgi:hypothetical protein